MDKKIVKGLEDPMPIWHAVTASFEGTTVSKQGKLDMNL